MSVHYMPDGQGRDTYIGLDQGGLMFNYQPDMQAKRGTFCEKRKFDLTDRSLCHIPSKHVSYVSNGSGRDSYIVQSNGGFYPEQTVAAYQQTFVNKLREHPRRPYNPNNALRAKSNLMRKTFQSSYGQSIVNSP
mmetsp:Transcript_16093/g.27180  ORF Transcript_16093/g.27180 Transcript_16093/m.27180 type:complete len:134 (-) Transcript_16093:640-1041(-)